ncbi:hypothetical protein [Enterobacter sp.]|uniref:hypothetical protein n=1 Tax=Enterobacter sp. TaxID=42895 RepID=UPI00296FB7BD|nr:hypothetical protein [Enterobacter sp.]
MRAVIRIGDTPHPSLKTKLLEDYPLTNYFSSRLHEIAFYFKVNNTKFDKYLGVTALHKADPIKAKELKLTYLKIFHPDANIKGEIPDLDFNEICQDIDIYFHRVSGGKLK